MAPTMEGDNRRQQEEDERPSQGRGRGPSRRWDSGDREWGPPTWGRHHHHHHHHHEQDGPEPARRRGGRRSERFGDDEFAQATRRLIGAVRAAGRDGDNTRRPAVAVMDEAARAIYRLLADGAEAPADAGPTGAAYAPDPETGPQPGPAVA
jgi:hypothetical protein